MKSNKTNNGKSFGFVVWIILSFIFFVSSVLGILPTGATRIDYCIAGILCLILADVHEIKTKINQKL